MRRPDEGSVLDRRTLNRTLLARQGLLERSATPVHEMIERLVGMQAQVPRDPYIGLAARVDGFEPATLEALLMERQAVRMTLMRTTLHLATARDARVLRAATQDVCARGFRSSMFRRRLDGVDLEAVVAAGTELLDARPLTTPELRSALAARWPDRDAEAMGYAVRYLVPVVQVPPRGLLHRSSVPRITTLRSWLGDGADDPAPTTEAAVDETVERYLRAFGPATAADVRTWSGMAAVRESLARLGSRLRRYRDDSGRELVDVADGRFAGPDDPAPVRFLGEFDDLFLAHADRSRITGDLSWGATWAGRGAFFAGGFLAGAWSRPDRDAPERLELDPRLTIPMPTRRDVEAEAGRLVRLLTDEGTRPRIIWADAAA